MTKIAVYNVSLLYDDNIDAGPIPHNRKNKSKNINRTALLATLRAVNFIAKLSDKLCVQSTSASNYPQCIHVDVFAERL